MKDYASRYGCSVLIETRTFEGDMGAECANTFGKIYSIELDTWFYEKAKRKFKDNNRINILQGDSGQKIVDVPKDLSEPTVFWLDGHYSARGTAKGDLDTPIAKEIEH